MEAALEKKEAYGGDLQALRGVWSKRHHTNDWVAAEAAYRAALAGGADPGVILASAERWLAVKGGRYLPALEKWLANETYLQSPGEPRARGSGVMQTAAKSDGPPRGELEGVMWAAGLGRFGDE